MPLSSGRDDRLTISHLLPPSWDSNRLASSCLPLSLLLSTHVLIQRSPPSKKQPDHLAYIPLDHIEVIHRKTNRCVPWRHVDRRSRPEAPLLNWGLGALPASRRGVLGPRTRTDDRNVFDTIGDDYPLQDLARYGLLPTYRRYLPSANSCLEIRPAPPPR